MPSAPTYPGVYVAEVASGVHTIVGVATSVTAFIGRAPKGPTDTAVDILSLADYNRQFGALSLDSPMSYSVRDFFQNGGSHAVIVRVFHSVAVSSSDHDAAVAAAGKVAAAAEGEATGADAKTKAAAALGEITADPTEVAAAKAAATRVNAAIQKLDDAATKAQVATAADTAKAAEAAAPLVQDFRTMSVGTLAFKAGSQGKWGGYLRIDVQAASGPAASAIASQLNLSLSDLFNLTVTDLSPGGSSEQYLNLSVKAGPRRVDNMLANNSSLILWNGPDLNAGPVPLPDFTQTHGDPVGEAYFKLLAAQKANPDPTSQPVKDATTAYNQATQDAIASVSDGDVVDMSDFLPTDASQRTGLYALEQLFTRDGIFNLLCIPPYTLVPTDVDTGVIAAAANYCEKRRAVLLVDGPSTWGSVDLAVQGFSGAVDQIGTRSSNAAIFFPRLMMTNPLQSDQVQSFSATGMIAGIFARTDTQRGVWKAPAGLDASLSGINSLSLPMTDDDNGELNPLGINCLRTFPVFGPVIWGARTLRGADAFADEYKYTPVRRTALFIEESLYRALMWVVFEPNDEPLWGQIRLNVGAFMQTLFRQGAFQGGSARLAYFVQCDATTTTQNDINLGIVNINVGFAPLKPAEFVVISLQQMAGQIAT